jgi:hypothetical protein
MKVWMFVSNNCRHDARVLKELGIQRELAFDKSIILIYNYG